MSIAAAIAIAISIDHLYYLIIFITLSMAAVIGVCVYRADTISPPRGSSTACGIMIVVSTIDWITQHRWNEVMKL